MLRRIFVLAALWVVLVALLSTGTAVAQEGSAEDEEPVEVSFYGDSELIEALRTYELLDEWIAASPVSPQASLLLVAGGNYQAQRQAFLDSLQAWANRTELVRTDFARVDAAQANTDRLRAIVGQVRNALVLDDRLANESNTLVEIEDALAQLAALDIPDDLPEESEDSLTRAEIQLSGLRDLAQAEVQALNGVAPAFTRSGIDAFVGFGELQSGFNSVDLLIDRGRELLGPAREESERLVSSALRQIPGLHASRLLGSSDVSGLSVVTVDAYIRAAARSSCSVDWALLAGIGQIESNHGRLGGASVSRSGQVSTTILGPLLDGGATERDTDEPGQIGAEQQVAIAGAIEIAQRAVQSAFENSWWGSIIGELEPGDLGNGFAVVVDTDNGRLDGNDQWDRAVGPMQFLPETWSKWATDGNGDGVSDPNNLYDAAASAGRFLCDLSATRGSSPSTFVLGYNSSTSYVRSVLSAAQRFRSISLPDA